MTKTSETTTIALIQLTQTQMGKDINNIASDIKEIKNSKYVTQNEMQLAISGSIKEVVDEISSVKKILWTVGGVMLVSIVSAILKVILIK